MRTLPLLLAAVVCSPKTEPPATAPTLEVTATDVWFGRTAPGCPAQRPVRVRNTGTATLEVTAVTLNGDAAFRLDGDVPAFTLAPDASRELTVVFAPTDDGPASAALVLSSNDRTATDRLTLSGEGGALEPHVDHHVQPPITRGDVALIVDTTCSMGGTITAARHMAALTETFATLGIDAHIGVLSAELGTDVSDGRLVGPWVQPTDEDAAATLADQLVPDVATKAPMRALGAARMLAKRIEDDANAGFRRPELPLGFIAITDNDDADLVKEPAQATDFAVWLDKLAGEPERTSWTSVTCATCTQLRAVATDSGGLNGSSAEADEVELDDLLRRAAYTSLGLRDGYPLSADVGDEATVRVTVDGQDETRFTVEDGRLVRFAPDAVPAPGAEITIAYDAGTCP